MERVYETMAFGAKAGFAGFVFLAGALTLAACQTVLKDREAPEFQLASDAYGLHYIDTGETAKLAYGKADSEMLGLMLECAKGSRRVEITDVAREARMLSLRAGGIRSDFPAAFQSAPGAPILSAKASSAAPALRGFRRTGSMQVTNGSMIYDVVATAAERPKVERFFAACERAA